MVRGMKKFQEHFNEYNDSFVIIGGAACDEWFSLEGIPFRATKDIDMIIILEAVTPDFYLCFRDFVKHGGYQSIQKSTGDKNYYRFTGPTKVDYPVMIELFARKPMEIELYPDQNIVPLPVDKDISSLSAILMNEGYYQVVMELRKVIDGGLPVVTPAGLIALKAKAWLDLSQRRSSGQKVDRRDIDKHRNDVFRLTVLLAGDENYKLPPEIAEELRTFLESFPIDSPDWQAISAALKASGITTSPDRLIQTLRDYFVIE